MVPIIDNHHKKNSLCSEKDIVGRTRKWMELKRLLFFLENAIENLPVIVIRLLFLRIDDACIFGVIHPGDNQTVFAGNTINLDLQLFTLNRLQLMMLECIWSKIKYSTDKIELWLCRFAPNTFQPFRRWKAVENDRLLKEICLSESKVI